MSRGFGMHDSLHMDDTAAGKKRMQAGEQWEAELQRSVDQKKTDSRLFW